MHDCLTFSDTRLWPTHLYCRHSFMHSSFKIYCGRISNQVEVWTWTGLLQHLDSFLFLVILLQIFFCALDPCPGASAKLQLQQSWPLKQAQIMTAVHRVRRLVSSMCVWFSPKVELWIVAQHLLVCSKHIVAEVLWFVEM